MKPVPIDTSANPEVTKILQAVLDFGALKYRQGLWAAGGEGLYQKPSEDADLALWAISAQLQSLAENKSE